MDKLEKILRALVGISAMILGILSVIREGHLNALQSVVYSIFAGAYFIDWRD